MSLGLTCLRQRHRLCRHIILVQAHLISTSQRVGDWVTDLVNMGKLPHLQPGISWPRMEVQEQHTCAIQCRERFSDLSEANFDNSRLIMHVSLEAMHSSPVSASLRSTYTTVHCVPLISVCFIVIMVSFVLNQWILCTQIIMYQDYTLLGAASLFRMAAAISTQWNLVTWSNREVWKDVECKHRWVNCSRASQLAFGITGFYDDWYKSTMVATVTCFATPQRVREKFRSIQDHMGRRQQLWECW
jgi:hypothetical protein